MAKATSIKEGLAKWEEKNGSKACDAKCVKLCGELPPIEKMDASLSTLVACEQLSLSSNAIEKIANLQGLKNLTILSLSRNLIKNLNGLEAVGDTLKELWISYNNIEKLKGVHVLKKLEILYMSNNAVKELPEFRKLADLPCLVDLLFEGNPLKENLADPTVYLEMVMKELPKLKKLDNTPIVRNDDED